MNKAKIEQLKAVLDAASNAYNAKKDELVATGLNSKQRYEVLKPLKAAEDAANAEYVKYTHGQIKRELHKICAVISAEKKADKAAKRAARFA